MDGFFIPHQQTQTHIAYMKKLKRLVKVLIYL